MKFIHCAIASVVLYSSLFSIPILASNIVVNGSFEDVQIVGNGDLYSDNFNGQGVLTSAQLPGWTFPPPTAPNSFFLEHGTPFGVKRFYDGRQVVAINADGRSFSLSQTLNTTIGAHYLFSFALGEEQVKGNSPSTVHVNLGSLSKDYAVGLAANRGLNGFVVFTDTFTATTNKTLLSFTDTTSGGAPLNSPFIDAVTVAAVPLPPVIWLFSSALLVFSFFGKRRLIDN